MQICDLRSGIGRRRRSQIHSSKSPSLDIIGQVIIPVPNANGSLIRLRMADELVDHLGREGGFELERSVCVCNAREFALMGRYLFKRQSRLHRAPAVPVADDPAGAGGDDASDDTVTDLSQCHFDGKGWKLEGFEVGEEKTVLVLVPSVAGGERVQSRGRRCRLYTPWRSPRYRLSHDRSHFLKPCRSSDKAN